MKFIWHYSSIFQRKIGSPVNQKQFLIEWNKVIHQGKEFEKFIEKIGQGNIFDAIKKYTGDYELAYEEIHVYFIKSRLGSFSDPVTLNVKEDNNLMFGILVHEVLHNYEAKFGFIKINNENESILREDKINQLSTRILNDLNIQTDSFIAFMESLKRDGAPPKRSM